MKDTWLEKRDGTSSTKLFLRVRCDADITLLLHHELGSRRPACLKGRDKFTAWQVLINREGRRQGRGQSAKGAHGRNYRSFYQ